MPELFLELFSEEIPARMQARAADDLARLLAEALASLAPERAGHWFGPRRIAAALRVRGEVPAASTSEGPSSGRLRAISAAISAFSALSRLASARGDSSTAPRFRALGSRSEHAAAATNRRLHA